jgi:photosystem II stability/assembly factor-like uncharacterized protein
MWPLKTNFIHMKKYLFLIASLIFAKAEAQWTQVSYLSFNGSGGPDTAKYCRDIRGLNDRLFAASEKGLFVSMNNGDTWSNLTFDNVTTQGNDNVNCISFLNINSNNVLFIGTETKIFSSSDNGITWTNKSTGIATGSSIKSIKQIGTTLFAAYYNSGSGGVYVSTDGGNSWAASNTGLPADWVECLYTDGATIYAGTKGVYSSSNNGLSWENKSAGLTTPLGIFAITKKGNALFAGSSAGEAIFKSVDNGTSWDSIRVGLPTGFCQVIGILVNSDKIYIAQSGAAGSSATYVSDNDGASWTSFDNGLPSGVFATTIGQNYNGSSLFTFRGFKGSVYRSGGAITGISSLETKSKEVEIYPNPGNGIFHLNYPEASKGNLEVYNLIGEKLKQEKVSNDLDLSAYPKGVYFVKISTENKTITQKIVLQ